jgi:chromatin remodeling complex protein RSC6
MAKDTKGQVEGILTELGKKIDLLIVEAKGASKEVRDDVEEKIQELKKKKEKIEKDFDGYKDKNEDKWNDAKSHFMTALSELKKAVESVFKDKSK